MVSIFVASFDTASSISLDVTVQSPISFCVDIAQPVENVLCSFSTARDANPELWFFVPRCFTLWQQGDFYRIGTTASIAKFAFWGIP